MRAAESATKWREAADFDTPLPAGAGTSPSYQENPLFKPGI
jgi:hypothetical protein